MKALKTLFIGLLLIVSMVATVAAQDSTVPVQIVSAELDKTDIFPNGKNTLDIERDEEFTLRLEMISDRDVDDVEIRAFISGYEYSDVSDISSIAGPYNFREGVTYVRSMTLSLPKDLPVDEYKLRVIVSDRFGHERIYRYDLSINTKRHDVRVDDVILSPGKIVESGQALLATVRLENFGQRDQDDVKVTVSIPELDVSGTAYVDEIEADKSRQTEEMFLRLPKCAEAGDYELKVKVEFNNGRDVVEKSMTVHVLENEACNVAAPVIVIDNNQTMTEQPVAQSSNKVRAALEIVLLVLLALLVIVGLVIGFSRMRAEE